MGERQIGHRKSGVVLSAGVILSSTNVLVLLLNQLIFIQMPHHCLDLGYGVSSAWNFSARSQTPFCKEASGDSVKCRLFFQAILIPEHEQTNAPIVISKSAPKWRVRGVGLTRG